MRSAFLAIAALLIVPCSQAFAWGADGHKITCEIAFRLVTADTREKIKALIATDPEYDRFSDACNWPDRPPTRNIEHYVNLARDAQGLSPGACPEAEKCVLSAIPADFLTLTLPETSQKHKLTALKYLGHWVGDVHQPLHVSFADDRGGNEILVSGECSGKLHSTWDSCILRETLGGTPDAIASNLVAEITPEIRAAWMAAGTEPYQWANESFRIATAAATGYCTMNNGTCDGPGENATVVIDEEFLAINGPIVRERLKQGGVRLAYVLDLAFSD